MLVVRFRFPGGLYHATPWGRHVNEGEVEWPPSPWRLARALVATGFGRCGWTEVPAAARPLLHALGGTVPDWYLPRGTLGHSRHYMPDFGGGTSKVIDAWVRLPRDADSFAAWAVDEAGLDLALLDRLLARLGWLGRSESWVEAARVEAFDARPDLVRVAAASEEGDPVDGLVILPHEVYARWRAARITERAAEVLATKQDRDVAKGKAPRERLTKGDLAKIEEGYPLDPVEALCMRSSELRGAGFSQPPGTRHIRWWRPADLLRAAPQPARAWRRDPPPRFALLAVTPDTSSAPALTRLALGLYRAEALHAALVKRAPVAEFVGSRDGHAHAAILPLTLGEWRPHAGTGRGTLPARGIDHYLVSCPGGLSAGARSALLRPPALYDADLPRQLLSCLGFAREPHELPSRIRQLGRARRWVSVTPFVPSRHLKRSGRSSLAELVGAELEWRQLPRPDRVEVEGREGWIEPGHWFEERRGAAFWRHFAIQRRHGGGAPPQRLALGLRITFREPVQGPIALGYGAHFGLGQFVPDDD